MARGLRRAADVARDATSRNVAVGSDRAQVLVANSTADLARRLDLDIGRAILGATYRHDVRRADIPVLLVSAAALARGRGQRAWVHVDGRLTHLDRGVPRHLLAAIERAGRFRLAVADARSALIENLCIEVWVPADQDSWRSIAADAPVRRWRSSLPESSSAVPVQVDTVPHFPVDAVYTWVNAADPAWRESAAQYRDLASIDPDRFVQADEIRYSLRSLDFFAPWIQRIHVLSNCKPPAWFKPSDRVRWVDHRDVIDGQYLPLFNSDAIETFLHRIPDLADHFIYLNDDFLLADSVFPQTFFTWDGRTIAHLLTRNSTLFMQQLVASGEAEDWESSRVNGARLLQERFGVFPTLLHQHAPYALTRSGWAQLETAYSTEIEATRRSRFRSHSDICWTAFVYHHHGLFTGSTLPGQSQQYEISRETMKRLARDIPETRTFAVVADRGGSADDGEFAAFKARFLAEHWPFTSQAEGPTGQA